MTARFSSRGFTLIELLVAVSIVLLLTGGGIAAFIRFNERQSVQAAALQMQTIIRAAQVKGRAGEQPEACGRLMGYRVQTTAGSGQVILSVVCDDGTFIHTTYQLANNVVTEGSYNMFFRNLYGGASGGTNVVVTLPSNPLLRYSFSVSDAGEIGAGQFLQ